MILIGGTYLQNPCAMGSLSHSFAFTLPCWVCVVVWWLCAISQVLFGFAMSVGGFRFPCIVAAFCSVIAVFVIVAARFWTVLQPIQPNLYVVVYIFERKITSYNVWIRRGKPLYRASTEHLRPKMNDNIHIFIIYMCKKSIRRKTNSWICKRWQP